ncbi:hypothetical protein C0Q70_10617 [Pomacea canaliculata]|uniref:Uncharacterized protein n=1 Tax=Pomacea canaliculata TaxID=400727 RepID=A0A2T7P3Q0_POMCA|nr:hypothetical protein C0Q70_10617 [Pomacea canaliculata]
MSGCGGGGGGRKVRGDLHEDQVEGEEGGGRTMACTSGAQQDDWWEFVKQHTHTLSLSCFHYIPPSSGAQVASLESACCLVLAATALPWPAPALAPCMQKCGYRTMSGRISLQCYGNVFTTHTGLRPGALE